MKKSIELIGLQGGGEKLGGVEGKINCIILPKFSIQKKETKRKYI